MKSYILISQNELSKLNHQNTAAISIEKGSSYCESSHMRCDNFSSVAVGITRQHADFVHLDSDTRAVSL